MIHDTFSINLEVTIRRATRADLHPLEWFGALTPFRETIEQAYQRAEQGEVIFLIAELNHFPIGQVCVDLVKLADEGIGVIWAFRVLATLQNLGIGTRLIHCAERAILAHGLHTAELGVELNNPNAQRLYERLGYHVSHQITEHWDYTSPDGLIHYVESPEFIMRKRLIEEES
jgi:ribosomal protein S18 acetylase RimI-like enzyme